MLVQEVREEMEAMRAQYQGVVQELQAKVGARVRGRGGAGRRFLGGCWTGEGAVQELQAKACAIGQGVGAGAAQVLGWVSDSEGLRLMERWWGPAAA